MSRIKAPILRRALELIVERNPRNGGSESSSTLRYGDDDEAIRCVNTYAHLIPRNRLTDDDRKIIADAQAIAEAAGEGALETARMFVGRIGHGKPMKGIRIGSDDLEIFDHGDYVAVHSSRGFLNLYADGAITFGP